MKIVIPLYVFIVLGLCTYFYQDSAFKESMERGREIYGDFCVTCHLDNGEGVPYTFPPLAKSDYLAKNRKASIHAVKYGLQGEIVVNGTTYNSTMTSMGLEDEEIADVLNFVMNSWGNTQEQMITEEEVTAVKK